MAYILVLFLACLTSFSVIDLCPYVIAIISFKGMKDEGGRQLIEELDMPSAEGY